MLVVEDVVMHLPELALHCGGLGSQSRVQGVGMDLGEWEVAKDKAQLLLPGTISKGLLHGFHYHRGFPEDDAKRLSMAERNSSWSNGFSTASSPRCLIASS